MDPKKGADRPVAAATEQHSCDRDILSHALLAIANDDDEEARRTSVTIIVLLYVY